MANDLASMAARRVEGEASEKYAAAVRDFAEAESKKIELELARRTFAARVEQQIAETKKSQAEAEKAQIDTQAAKLELLERLIKLGLVPVRVGAQEFLMARLGDSKADAENLVRAFLEEDRAASTASEAVQQSGAPPLGPS